MSLATPRLRVLLITHGLPPESIGGVEQHVDGLARALLAAGHDVHVHAKTGRAGLEQGEHVDDPPGTAPYRTTRVVYRYEGLDSLLSLYAVPALDAALERFLASQPRFDVAHVHHLTGLSTGTLAVLRARGIPVVLTLHDYWTICPRGQMWHRDGSVTERVDPARCADCLRPSFGGWVPAGDAGVATMRRLHEHARACLELPERLVVPSARALAPFLALGVPRERFTVVENGVDVEALRALPLPDVLAPRRLRLGYLGTLIPSKGLDVLVAAWQRLPEGELELHVHGNVVPYHGETGFLTKALMGLRPGDRFAYHGCYRTEDLPRRLAGLDLLCAPALWHEAFGLTVREALAAGRPVIVSRVGGLQDAVPGGAAGRVVSPGAVDELANALRELTADRHRLLEAARAARALPIRGFAPMAAELATLYAGLMRRA
ncbi:MAG: glycosyltransferase family 4 protein [Planctomycetes bacterium]|nr:glycosyltransferase family 4 protein [Planctomycetota bacterium]